MKTKTERQQRKLWMAAMIGFALAILFTLPRTTLAQQWNTSGNNIYNTNSGFVGIGTAAPIYPFHIVATESDTAGVTNYGSLFTLNASPSSNSGATFIASRTELQTANNSSSYGTLIAQAPRVFHNGTGPVADMRGNNLVAANESTAIITSAVGGQFAIRNDGAGTITTAMAGNFLVQNLAANGLMTNAYGVRVQDIVNNSSTMTNTYGVYVGNLTAGTHTNTPFSFYASDANTNNYFAGNVGIGTSTPATKLHVVGDLTVTGNIAAKYQDMAEWVPAREQISAGTVVVLDVTKSNQVTASSLAYDTRVAGVVSAQPGIALGERGDGKVLVATTGRVRVKVDASHGPIHIGDLLVTSDIRGVAMKSEPVNVGGRLMHMPGTLIGKALEPLEKGSGTILVLLSLQ